MCGYGITACNHPKGSETKNDVIEAVNNALIATLVFSLYLLDTWKRSIAKLGC